MSKLKAHISETAKIGIPDKTHRVLFIDDDPAILFAYSKMLERERICVDSCECLHEAIRHIRAHSYLAVVTDLRLAGTENTDGLDVIRALRKEQPRAQFILATGCCNCEIEQNAREMGATHVFEKPVIPAKIIEAIRSLIQNDTKN
jgi:two-component system, NtrC family, C4-dicarboxylate transport response regulator DctD